MTNDKVHPCLKHLDADCFRARPAWAKQAFAYRIVHLLTPKALTKRLPKGLRRALLAPGLVIPPGVEMPPGVVVGPGGEIPAGWTPGDPLPPGAIPPGETPPGTEATGITPPTFVAPGEPGPVTPPAGHIYVPPGLWFDEPFTNLTANSWSDDSYQTGSASTPDGALKLHGISTISHSVISRTDTRDWPENWQLQINVNYFTGNYEMRYRFFTGTYSFEFRLYPPDQVRLYAAIGPDYWSVPNYIDQYKICLITVTGGTLDLSWNGDEIKTGWSLKSDTSNAGLMDLRLANICTTYTDYLKITAL